MSRSVRWLARVDGHVRIPDDADLVEAALDAGVERALRDAHDGDPSARGEPVSALRAAALVDRRRAGHAARSRPTPRCPTGTGSAPLCEPASRPSPPKRRVTPAPTEPCSARSGEVSTSAARPTAGPPASAARSPLSDSRVVFSPGATGLHPGRTSTTARPGANAAALQWTTARCSVGGTTRSSTRRAGE